MHLPDISIILNWFTMLHSYKVAFQLPRRVTSLRYWVSIHVLKKYCFSIDHAAQGIKMQQICQSHIFPICMTCRGSTSVPWSYFKISYMRQICFLLKNGWQKKYKISFNNSFIIIHSSFPSSALKLSLLCSISAFSSNSLYELILSLLLSPQFDKNLSSCRQVYHVKFNGNWIFFRIKYPISWFDACKVMVGSCQSS